MCSYSVDKVGRARPPDPSRASSCSSSSPTSTTGTGQRRAKEPLRQLCSFEYIGPLLHLPHFTVPLLWGSLLNGPRQRKSSNFPWISWEHRCPQWISLRLISLPAPLFHNSLHNTKKPDTYIASKFWGVWLAFQWNHPKPSQSGVRDHATSALIYTGGGDNFPPRRGGMPSFLRACCSIWIFLTFFLARLSNNRVWSVCFSRMLHPAKQVLSL